MQTNSLYTEGCIRTFSGEFISVLEPKAVQVFVVDIAVGLSREMRFGGHTKKPYSVSEHSIWCADKAAELYPDNVSLPFKLLLHDAHEAYLKDIPSPVKSELGDYKKLADLHQDVIHSRYCVRISNTDKELIKQIDTMALEWEYEHKKLNWHGLELNDRARIDLFINHFVKLCKVPFTIQP